MLGGIEELAVQPDRIAVGAVGRIGHGVPQGIILAGIGQVVFFTHLKGIGALQVPEGAGGIGEDDAVVGDGLQIPGQGELDDPGLVGLSGGDGQGDGVRGLVVIGLRIAEVVLLPQLGGRDQLPIGHLLEGSEVGALGHQDLLLELVAVGEGVAGVEEVINVLHLHHRAGADPAVLAAAAGGLQDHVILLGVGDEILGGGQIDGMVVGVAALLQIVDVVGAVLIVGHGVPHEGLGPVVLGGQEKGFVGIRGLLAAGGPKHAEVRFVLGEDKALPVRGHIGRSSGLSFFPFAAEGEAQQKQERQKQGLNTFIHRCLL